MKVKIKQDRKIHELTEKKNPVTIIKSINKFYQNLARVMGKRKVTSDTTREESLNLYLDLSNLPDIEDTTPLMPRKNTGSTFGTQPILENGDKNLFSELAGQDQDAQNKEQLDLE